MYGGCKTKKPSVGWGEGYGYFLELHDGEALKMASLRELDWLSLPGVQQKPPFCVC